MSKEENGEELLNVEEENKGKNLGKPKSFDLILMIVIILAIIGFGAYYTYYEYVRMDKANSQK